MNPLRMRLCFTLAAALGLVACSRHSTPGVASSSGGSSGPASSSGGATSTGAPAGWGEPAGSRRICDPCQQHSDCMSGYCHAGVGPVPFCDTSEFCQAGQCGQAACLPTGSCDCHLEPAQLGDGGSGSSSGSDGGAALGCDACMSDSDCRSGHCHILNVVGVCEGSTCAGLADCSAGFSCRGGTCDCSQSSGGTSSSSGPTGSGGSTGGTSSGGGADCAPCTQNSDCQSQVCNDQLDPAHPYCDRFCDGSRDAGPAFCGGYGCSNYLCACPGHGGASSGGSTSSSTSGGTGGSTSSGSTGGSTGSASGSGTVAACGACTQNADCQSGYCNTFLDPVSPFCDASCQSAADCGGYACAATGSCACPFPDGGARAGLCQPCSQNADCQSWFCNTYTRPGQPYCDTSCSGSECGAVGCSSQGACACP